MTPTNQRAVEETYSKVIKALAAIVNVHTPDNLFDLDAIPRDPVMTEVVRIRKAMDALSTTLRTPGWRPISEAPRDGTRVLLANEHGCWMAEYQPVYVSGYRPENPWFSVMLNCDHIPLPGRYAKPTHFMPLPPPPGEGE